MVASADPDGTLSNFTNYNETIVDVAIGGSSIPRRSANVGEHYISSVGATAQPGTSTTQKAVNYAAQLTATPISTRSNTTLTSWPRITIRTEPPIRECPLRSISFQGAFSRASSSTCPLQQLSVTADFEPNGFVELSLYIPNPFRRPLGCRRARRPLPRLHGQQGNSASGVLSAQAAVKLVGDTGSVEIAAMPSHQYSDVTYKIADPAALANGSPTLQVKLVLLPANQETQTTTLTSTTSALELQPAITA